MSDRIAFLHILKVVRVFFTALDTFFRSALALDDDMDMNHVHQVK